MKLFLFKGFKKNKEDYVLIPTHIEKLPQKMHFEGLDFARALAVLLVFYCHNLIAFTTSKGIELSSISIIRNSITNPLAIIQDFGFLAVSLFFLLSGFLITYKGIKENLKTFLIKRIFRIYPAWIFAVLIIQTINIFLNHDLILSQDKILNFGELLKCITLWGYMELDPVWIIGVGWTLIIEVIFYLLFAVSKIFGKHNLSKLIIFNMVVVTFCIVFLIQLGDNFYPFCKWMSYVPCLIFGQLIYAFYTEGIKTKYILLSIINYYIFLWGNHKILQGIFLAPDNSYVVSLFYATLIFIFLLKTQWKCPYFFKYIALISYSIYIYHGNIGQLVMIWLPNNLFWLSFGLSIIITFLVSALSYEFIEKRGQVIARSILRSKFFI